MTDQWKAVGKSSNDVIDVTNIEADNATVNSNNQQALVTLAEVKVTEVENKVISSYVDSAALLSNVNNVLDTKMNTKLNDLQPMNGPAKGLLPLGKGNLPNAVSGKVTLPLGNKPLLLNAMKELSKKKGDLVNKIPKLAQISSLTPALKDSMPTQLLAAVVDDQVLGIQKSLTKLDFDLAKKKAKLAQEAVVKVSSQLQVLRDAIVPSILTRSESKESIIDKVGKAVKSAFKIVGKAVKDRLSKTKLFAGRSETNLTGVASSEDLKKEEKENTLTKKGKKAIDSKVELLASKSVTEQLIKKQTEEEQMKNFFQNLIKKDDNDVPIKENQLFLAKIDGAVGPDSSVAPAVSVASTCSDVITTATTTTTTASAAAAAATVQPPYAEAAAAEGIESSKEKLSTVMKSSADEKP